MKDKKSVNHYIDKDKFTKAMQDFEIARDASDDPEKFHATDYIYSCIMLIVENFIRGPSLNTSRADHDTLVSDSIFDCIKALPRFQTEKSKNPFNYFSQITYFCVLRGLQTQQREFTKRCKLVQSRAVDFVELNDEISGIKGSLPEVLDNTVSKLQQYMEFDLTPVEKQKKLKPRSPLYLQNRTAEEVQEVKDRQANKANRTVKDAASILESLTGK